MEKALKSSLNVDKIETVLKESPDDECPANDSEL